jgi:hypothetical protein
MKKRTIKSIHGVSGYLVGNDGTVWSQWRTRGRKGQRGVESFIDEAKLEPIKPRRHSGGYLSVALRCDGKYVYYLIHRLVLEVFVGPCPEGCEGCHRDGDKKNNRRSNLYWGTRQQNMDDAVRHGTTTHGTRNSQAKLTEDEVKAIVVLLDEGELTFKEIAETFNVSSPAISLIARGANWVRITGGKNRSPGHWSKRSTASEVSERFAIKLRGRKLSKAHKQAISAGLTASTTHKEACKARRGQELTTEHREKVSMGMQRVWASPEGKQALKKRSRNKKWQQGQVDKARARWDAVAAAEPVLATDAEPSAN